MGKVQALEKGMLLLYKVPKGKIEPKSLGWVCPESTINFATSEAANNYAKNTVIKALNVPKPYEKSVVVSGKRITFEHEGTEGNCLVPLNAQGTWVHGHPDMFGKGKTTPFSATDYDAFLSVKGIDKAIIYNSIGESSTFVKKPKKTLLDKLLLKFMTKSRYDVVKTQAQIGRCGGGYNTAMLNCSADMTLKLNKLAIKRLFAMMKGDAKLTEKYTEEYAQLYQKEMEKALKEENVANRIHKFWVRFAKKLDIEYSTNFSNLV